MRHRQGRGPAAQGAEARGSTEVFADPVESARAIGDVLPDAIARAEAAGLSIIAQHLGKALDLARRIVASGAGGG